MRRTPRGGTGPEPERALGHRETAEATRGRRGRWARPEGPRGAGGEGAVAEERQSLYLLAASPTIWLLHFLVCYVGAAVWCAKVAGRDAALGEVRLVVAVATVAALAGIGVTWAVGFRRHRHGRAEVPHDHDTPEDRHRFLGFATVLLSGLSAVAVVYVAMGALFLETCR